MKTYFVYILASGRNGTLYAGITNDLKRRMDEHLAGDGSDFTKKYHLKQLVYYEQTENAEVAIAREKQLKNWTREWKMELIEATNPKWEDVTGQL